MMKRTHLFALLVSIIIAFFRLDRLFWNPNDTILGGWSHPDNLGNHWLLVWVAEQLSHGRSILHNETYYIPFGDHPWLAGNGSEGIWFIPFYLLFGWPAGAGIMSTIFLIAIGLAGYRLARAANLPEASALICCAGIASSTYLVRELNQGHVTQANILWLTLALGSLFRLLLRNQKRDIASFAIFAALTAVGYWYYGWFLFWSALLICLCQWIRTRKLPWKSLVLSTSLSLVLVAPVLWLFISHWSSIPGTGETLFPSKEASHDSLPFTLPFLARHGKTIGFLQALPVLLLSCAPLFYLRKEKLSLASISSMVLLIFFTLLAMGDKAFLFEWIYSLHPATKRFWWPSRHLALYDIAWPLLAASGSAIVLSSIAEKKRIWIGLFVALSIPISLRIQGNVPFSVAVTTVNLPPPVYPELSQQKIQAILQPPLSPKISHSQTHLIQQLYHKKQLLTGHAMWVDRVRPQKWDAFVEGNSYLSGLQMLEQAEDGTLSFKEQDMQALRDLGIDVFVLDPELFPRPLANLVIAYRNLNNQMFGQPILQEKGISVWSFDGWNQRTSYPLPKWTWPKGIRKSDGFHRLNLPSMPSNIHTMKPKHRSKKVPPRKR